MLFAGFTPYVRAALCGEVKPHAFSWLIWFILTIIAASAQYAEGGGAGVIPTVIGAFTCLILCYIGFKQGTRNITKADKYALAAAFLTLPLWYFTSDPFWSVVLIVVIDAIGFFPTFRKSWAKPQEERALAYFLFAISTIISIFALAQWTATTLLFPVYMCAINFTMWGYLLVRRKMLKRAV